MYTVWIDIKIQLEATRWLCHQDIAFNTVSTKLLDDTFHLYPEIGFIFPDENNSVLFALRWA